MKRFAWIVIAVFVGGTASAQTGPTTGTLNNLGVAALGCDDKLEVTTGVVEISTQNAKTGTWNGAPPSNHNPGDGIYDPVEWLIVYRHTYVDIASGATVTYKNDHPSGAPVVWIVGNTVMPPSSDDGSVTIDGTLDLSGEDATGGWGLAPTIGGPGGFRGGGSRPQGSPPGAHAYGFGPGGAWGHGSHKGGGLPYGNDNIVPLLGGSGGSSQAHNASRGGAGGGAVLIIAKESILLDGSIVARGGDRSGGNAFHGAGGAIRLVTKTYAGSGTLDVRGGGLGTGGHGRLHVRAVTFDMNNLPTSAGGRLGFQQGLASADTPFPIVPNKYVKIESITVVGSATVSLPDDPSANVTGQPNSIGISAADATLEATQTDMLLVRILTKNWNPSLVEVNLKITPLRDNSAGLVVFQSASHVSAPAPPTSPPPAGYDLWTVQVPVTDLFNEQAGGIPLGTLQVEVRPDTTP